METSRLLSRSLRNTLINLHLRRRWLCAAVSGDIEPFKVLPDVGDVCRGNDGQGKPHSVLYAAAEGRGKQ